MRKRIHIHTLALITVTFLLFGISVSGCIDEIDFDIEREAGKLVVSGGIYDHDGPFTVKLGRTDKVSRRPKPVIGAEVTLFDHRDNRFRYLETEPGIFTLSKGMVDARRGDSFHIEIELRDGRIYRSIPETIPMQNGEPETVLDPGFIQEPTVIGRLINVPVISIYANTRVPDHTEPLFLKWDIKSVYAFRETEASSSFTASAKTCYITLKTEPQTINLIRTDELSSNFIDNHRLVTKSIIRDQYFIRHVFVVTVSSISEQRYLYWKNVDMIINQTGTIFDVPPATVKGNIVNVNDENDFALGYFEAAARNSSHDFVTRADMPVHIPNPCSNRGPSQCRDCLIINNSSLERPDYF